MTKINPNLRGAPASDAQKPQTNKPGDKEQSPASGHTHKDSFDSGQDPVKSAEKDYKVALRETRDHRGNETDEELGKLGAAREEYDAAKSLKSAEKDFKKVLRATRDHRGSETSEELGELKEAEKAYDAAKAEMAKYQKA